MWEDGTFDLDSILTGKVASSFFRSTLLLLLIIWCAPACTELGAACAQLSTTEGNSYYVGTKMDAFVFDTLNAWYQEDGGTNSVSGCLPSALRLCGHSSFLTAYAARHPNQALPQTDFPGGNGNPDSTADSSGSSSSATPSAPAFPGVQQSSGEPLASVSVRMPCPVAATDAAPGMWAGSAGSTDSASSEAATPAATPPSIFGRVSSGGLFGGLSALFNTSSASPMGTVTAVAGAPAVGPSAAQAPLPANSVAGAEPTDSVAALITTNKGVSLVFDPLIRPPQQVAAAVQQAAGLVTGGRR